jgi:hypothetical protein
MKHHLPLILGSGVSFLIGGLVIWPVSYSEISLPTALFGFPLWVVFFCAVLAKAFSKSGWVVVTLCIGSGPLLAYFVRMIVDTSKDPTSHNLWPIALFITGIVTFPVAGLGAAVVSFVQWMKKKKAGRNGAGNP